MLVNLITPTLVFVIENTQNKETGDSLIETTETLTMPSLDEEENSSTTENISSTTDSSKESQEIESSSSLEKNNLPEEIENKFATIIGEIDIFDQTLETVIGNTKEIEYKVYRVKERITTNNTEHYYLLENSSNQRLGYVSEKALKLSDTAEGVLKREEKYVAIISKTAQVFATMNASVGVSSAEYYGKPFKSEDVIETFTGKKYLLLTDKDQVEIGYIEESATKDSLYKHGLYQKYGKYVTITSSTDSIWQSFNWKKRANSSVYKGQTLEARGYYNHFNGLRYLSLYDNKDKWVGYIDENATKLGKNKGGKYQSYSKYVKIKSKNYDIWQNFNWEKRDHSSNYYNQELEARGYYEHFNSGKYLSLYNSKGKWVGYINQKATKDKPIVKEKNG